jgi:hypothetical protein
MLLSRRADYSRCATVSALYPRIGKWVIPRSAFVATLRGVRSAGVCGKESGAFWLGQRDRTSVVQAVVLPLGVGVTEHSYYWNVDAEVFGSVTDWAKPRGLCLLAIAHTHMPGVPAVFSWADHNQIVQVDGMLGLVIGNGGADEDYQIWGWYLHERSQYRKLLRPELQRRLRVDNRSRIAVVRADARSVYEESESCRTV